LKLVRLHRNSGVKVLVAKEVLDLDHFPYDDLQRSAVRMAQLAERVPEVAVALAQLGCSNYHGYS
jgi:hypothetical protein